VLRPDPLNWFAHEKVASDVDPGKPYQITSDISRDAMDPGERALAGVLSVAGSLSAKLAPMVGRAIGSNSLDKASVPWDVAPIRGVGSIDEALDVMHDRKARPVRQTGQVMGLFDIKQRHPGVRRGDEAAAKHLFGRFENLDDLRTTVDSFIDKHDLKAKGVRLNIQNGPLSGLSGGAYHPATKEVYLPRVGKEVVLHELGHAADYSTRIGRVRAFAEPALERGVMMALPIALAAGDHIKEMIPGTVDDRAISFMQDHAPGIMAATLTATTLYPEAKASISAIRHIRDLERAGRQPAGATVKAFKRLSPLFGSYLLGAVPAVVGMALAKKYMNQARDEKRELQENAAIQFEELEKSAAGFLTGVRQVGDVAKQIAIGTRDLMTHPHTLRRLGRAAKEVGGSPEFIRGALGAAIPATLGALYIYGTPGGKEVSSRMHPDVQSHLLRHKGSSIGPAAIKDEKWRGEHPFRFAGMVAAGAALSGGIMSRFIHDLTRVL